MATADCTNLKGKTIFDLTDDPQIIADLVVSKEDFMRDLKEYPLYNAHVLIDYAELINDTKLLHAVKALYKKELDAENNE